MGRRQQHQNSNRDYRSQRNLPEGLPRELSLTIKAGQHPKTKERQWTARLEINDPNFAYPINARVIVNEKEWSGPLADGETWMIRPNNYLPEHQLLFCDALYRTEDSAVKVERTWHHPLVMDVYEEMNWDIWPVSAGGYIQFHSWKREQVAEERGGIRHSYKTGRMLRSYAVKRGDGHEFDCLQEFYSEAGWLVMKIKRHRAGPEYNGGMNGVELDTWIEEVRIPLCQCRPHWHLRSMSQSMEIDRRFDHIPLGFGHGIMVDDGRWISLSHYGRVSDRGAHGPFDPSKVGQAQNRGKLDQGWLDQLLIDLLPGKIFRVFDRDTAEKMRAVDYHFVGVVRAVRRSPDGSWEITFQKDRLWFKQRGAWKAEDRWECVGSVQRNRDEPYRYVFKLPQEQRDFLGFHSLRFRSLRMPGHDESSGDRAFGVTSFSLQRNESCKIVGFDGILSLDGYPVTSQGIEGQRKLPSSELADSAPRLPARWEGRTTVEVFDPNDWDLMLNQRADLNRKLPPPLLRKMQW